MPVWQLPPEVELELLEKYKDIIKLEIKQIEYEIEMVNRLIEFLKSRPKEVIRYQQPQMYPYMPQPQYGWGGWGGRGGGWRWGWRTPTLETAEVDLTRGSYKVAIASEDGGGLNDNVASVFARAPTFTIVDIVDGEVKNVSVVSNPYRGAGGGAGFMVAEYVRNLGVSVVIAGNFGPNSIMSLNNMGIKTITSSGKIEDVINRLIRK